jgi:hypothetical protein
MEVDQKTVFSPNRHDILNAFLIHKSCGGKMTHKKFREILVRELIIHSQEKKGQLVAFQGADQVQLRPSSVNWK